MCADCAALGGERRSLAVTIMLGRFVNSPNSDMLAKAAALAPVTVPKPWGSEIWYSGVEARGESRVRRGAASVPLSRHLQELGRDAPVVLLKVLKPTAGDLYIEVHQSKSEVYIVDAIDPACWPAAGRMLLGVDQRSRAALGDRGYRAALAGRARAAEAGTAEVREVAALLRSVTVRQGDMVAIPAGVPHSLLRGVQVVEFQTPVYERRILAASLGVVTQRGWDVDAAVALADLDAVPAVYTGGGPTRVCADGFEVWRLRGPFTETLPAWAVGWVMGGSVHIGEVDCGPRSAFLTSAPATVRGVSGAVALVAVETRRSAAEAANAPAPRRARRTSER